MREALVLVLLFFAAAAVAQSSSPQQKPSERATAPRESTLNLKLDDADIRSLPRSTPERRDPAGPGADGLPSLGANARPIPKNTSSGETIPSSRTPFPQDSERSQ